MHTVKSTVIARSFGVPGQAIVSIGDTHIVVGSSALRGTMSRSSDLLLASLAMDCLFTSQQAGVSLKNLMVTAHADEQFTAIELRLIMSGPTPQQANQIITYIHQHSLLLQLFAVMPTITHKLV